MPNGSPKCCGRAMSRRDGMYVCSRCRGWLDISKRGRRGGQR